MTQQSADRGGQTKSSRDLALTGTMAKEILTLRVCVGL